MRHFARICETVLLTVWICSAVFVYIPSLLNNSQPMYISSFQVSWNYKPGFSDPRRKPPRGVKELYPSIATNCTISTCLVSRFPFVLASLTSRIYGFRDLFRREVGLRGRLLWPGLDISTLCDLCLFFVLIAERIWARARLDKMIRPNCCCREIRMPYPQHTALH